MSERPHIAIVGAGPVGLEAALTAAGGGFPFTVYEAGVELAANVRSWGHVRMFTPWSMNFSPRMTAALERASRTLPDAGVEPTGDELLFHLLEPLSELPQIAPHVRLGQRVRAIGREGLLKHEEIATARRAATPFRLLIAHRDGSESITHADIVLDCTGTYGTPNSTGDGGIPAPGEKSLDRRIVRFLPNLSSEEGSWAGQTVLLVGGGHSAQTAACELADFAQRHTGTRVHWVLRAAAPHFGGSEDALPARAALHARAQALLDGGSSAFTVHRGALVDGLSAVGSRLSARLRTAGGPAEVMVDRVLSLTGGVGDHKLYRQLQVHECYAFAAPMKLSAALLAASGGSADCLDQQSHGVDALKNPEPGFFILGAKSYGRNNTFLLRVGYQQVEEVFAFLAG